MPTLHVELFAGRSPEVKAKLAQALTNACVDVLGGPAHAVDIIFRDVERHDWATGGTLWSAKTGSTTTSQDPPEA